MDKAITSLEKIVGKLNESLSNSSDDGSVEVKVEGRREGMDVAAVPTTFPKEKGKTKIQSPACNNSESMPAKRYVDDRIFDNFIIATLHIINLYRQKCVCEIRHLWCRICQKCYCSCPI